MDIKQVSDIPNWDDMELRRDFPDGTEVRVEPWIRREAPETTTTIAYVKKQSNRTHWVNVPSDRVFEFSEGNSSDNRNKAGALAVLWYRSDGFEITDSQSTIPVEIAAMGKPAIATYLDVIHSTDRKRIGDLLDISKGTVDQYISKVRLGQR
jgi:hypothetical protein